MVDAAALATSSSVPHWKQRICICSIVRETAGAAGRNASWTRKCSRHFLQMLEYAPLGSACTCPHFGHVTGTVSLFGSGMQFVRRRAADNGRTSRVCQPVATPGLNSLLLGAGVSLYRDQNKEHPRWS